MASAYSILRNYGDYIQPYDFNLIQQGLEYKQQKFDANTAKIQAQVDQFANLQLAKPEDREYMNERLQTLVDQINQYGSIDVSSNGVTRNIQNHVKQVLDENVLTAYAGTQKLKAYQEEVEYFKKNRPKEYSPVNEMYGMQGAIAWLNDGKVGTEFKGASYTPFTDVQGKLNTLVMDMVKNRPEQEVQFPLNNGLMIKKKVKELNADEIRAAATNMLSAQDQQQISINGWYNFGQVSPEKSVEVLQKYSEERINGIDGNIAALRLKSKEGLDETTLQEYENQITFLEGQKAKFESRVSSVPPSSAEIGSFLEQEKLINGLISTHAFKEMSVLYDVDQNYWNGVNHNYKILKDNRDYNLDLMKYGLDERKQQFQEDKFKLEQLKEGQTSADNNDNGAKDYTVGNIPTDAESTLDGEEAIYNDISKYESQRKALTEDYYSKLSGSTKVDFDRTVDAVMTLTENKDRPIDEVRLEVALKLANGGRNSAVMDVGTFQKFSKLRNNLNSTKQLLVTEADKTITDIGSKAETLYDVAMDEESIFTFTETETGLAPVSLKEYLEDKGISSFEDLQSNKEEYDKFLKLSVTQMFYDDMWLGGRKDLKYEGTLDNVNGKVIAVPLRQDGKIPPKADFYVKQLSQLTGEKDLKFEDLYEEDGIGVNYQTRTKNKLYKLKRQKPAKGGKAWEFLKNVQDTDAYGTKGAWYQDDSFADDRDSSKILSYDANKDAYKERLTKAYGLLPQNKVVTVEPKTPMHAELTLRAEKTGGYVVDANTSINVYENPDSRSEVIIEQIQTVGKSTKAGIIEKPRTFSIPKEELKGTQFERIINLETSKPILTVENMQPIVKKGVSFASDNNISYVQGVRKNVLGDKPLTNVITKRGAKNSIHRDYGAFYYDSEGKPNGVKEIVEKFIEDGSRFDLTVAPNADKTSIILSIDYQDEEGKVRSFDSYDLQTTNLDEEQDIINITPQIYLYTSLQRALNEAAQQAVLSGEFTDDRLEKLKRIYNTAK